MNILLAIISLVSIILLLYSITKLPTRIDYQKLQESIRRNFHKIIIAGLFLYGAYLTILYSNMSRETEKHHREYLRMLSQQDSLHTANRVLMHHLDSLVEVQREPDLQK